MKNLSAEISLSDENAIEGQEVSLIETVTNQKWLPLPIIQVKFMTSKDFAFADNNNSKISDQYYRNDILSLMMFQKITRTLTFKCTHRGYYEINNMDVVCSNMFVSLEKMQRFNLDIHLYVYPRPVEFTRIEVPFHKMLGTVLTKRFINEDPFEFRSIREYQSYDALKSINWKASAKTGSLMVNVNDYTSSQQIKIFLNLELKTMRIYEDIVEESIRIAAAFATVFIEKGIPVSISTNAKDIMTKELINVPAGSGRNHIRACMEALSRIDTSLGLTSFVPTIQHDFINATENEYIILISSYQEEELQDLLLSKPLKDSFSWIIPTNNEVKVKVGNDLSSKVIPWEIR
jgi:Uncharacterized conserved protein (some members contain a von Willebrand factor type A (vWA) domain)